jgi:outer membrane protein assembly factor BamB
MAGCQKGADDDDTHEEDDHDDSDADDSDADDSDADDSDADDNDADDSDADDSDADNGDADNGDADNGDADDGDKPADDGDKPADDGDKPADDGDKPADDGDKPADDGDKPADDGDKPADGEAAVQLSWPMWGGTIGRNMVNASTGLNFADFLPPLDDEVGKRILYQSQLGSQTYGNPVVASGVILVGTNNGAEHRPKHKGDRGVMLCFDQKNGDLLWQLTREKLLAGRVNDWPLQGICSSPTIEGDRAWVVTNRCELMCVDLKGFHDGKNNGPYTEEVDDEELDADIIWSLDMIDELGVFPHNLATSSPVIYGDLIYILTSNGVDEAHLQIPSPRAPSFIAVNKNSGELVWEDNAPFDKILHGQWGSPAIGVVNGKAQVYLPGGDGWLYALDAATGNHLWKFDLNPKDSVWELGGAGSRNAIIGTPVFVDNCVLLAVGQDPEHGEGVGHLYRIDATKTGDVSPVREDGSKNPNSAMTWHYGGENEEGDVFRRTLSTVAVADGVVYAADLSGRLHSVDYKTGERLKEVDVLAGIWGSPMVVDGHVLLGDEDGDLAIYNKKLELVREVTFNSSIYSTPTIVGDVMYVTDRSRLYAISLKK